MAKRYNVKRNIQKNIIIYISVFCVFVLAVSLGAVKTSKLDHSQFESLKAFTDKIFNQDIPVNFSYIIKTAILDNLKIMAFIIICSLSYPVSFLSFLPVALKGFSIGFTSGFVIYIYKMKGILYLLSTVVIEGVLLLPVMMHLCAMCINYTLEKKKHKQNTLSYFGYMVIIFLIMICLTIINGIFSSFMIKRF